MNTSLPGLPDYVERVGTAFAIAIHTDQKFSLHARMEAAEAKLRQIVAIVESWENQNTPDSDALSTEMAILQGMRISQLSEQIRLTDESLSRIMAMGPISGTSPGAQSHLDALGLNITMKSLDEIFGDGE